MGDGAPGLGELLGDPGAAGAALEALPPEQGQALAALAEQSVRRGIDYASLGLGWSHPETRLAYRHARGQSFGKEASRARQQRSRERLVELAKSLAERAGRPEESGQLIAAAFCEEIGAPRLAPPGCPKTSFAAVAAALQAELLLPLRALNEGTESMTRTFQGAPVPRAPIEQAVGALTAAVLEGEYSRWRYENPVGREQLRGLTEAQVEKWREPTETRVGTLRVHEDSAGELGLFWATKIGGPSHGFDFEGQCLLPLLCNARHKVVLVTAEEFPHNPCGRAHFRLLWVAGSEPPRAVLWLEGVHMDGAVWEHGAHVPRLDGPVLEHAVAKAVAMGVGLSVSSHLRQELARVAGGRGEVRQVNDAVVLRPSNGVVEASDYLDSRHDWVQMKEEVTGRHSRALFEPRAER